MSSQSDNVHDIWQWRVQVGVLLNSLGINAAALPARIHNVHNGAFDQAWQSGIPPEESAMRAAHEAAVLQQARQQQQATGNGWVGTHRPSL